MSRKATSLGKSPAVMQRKLASFRAAAKLSTVNSMTPQATSPTPNVQPVVQPLKAAPKPPKIPSSGGTTS